MEALTNDEVIHEARPSSAAKRSQSSRTRMTSSDRAQPLRAPAPNWSAAMRGYGPDVDTHYPNRDVDVEVPLG